jgi:protein arginine N-methyltransferase 1
MIRNYQKMIADKIRMEAYRKAIIETVKPGDIVLDLGTGLGILAFLSCQAGAQKVYAIEQSQIISVANQICWANGFQDKVTFIKDHSMKVKLPETVDVIITEILGTFALDENILPSIIDARDRFLKSPTPTPPGRGRKLIPSKIELFLAAIESKAHYSAVEFWDSPLYGISFKPARAEIAKIPHAIRIKESECLSDAVSLKRFDLQMTNEITLDEKISFKIKKTGILHGWGGWFEVQLTPNISISTSPAVSETHWKNIFFPSIVPMRVNAGDVINLHIRSVKREDHTAWWWRLA